METTLPGGCGRGRIWTWVWGAQECVPYPVLWPGLSRLDSPAGLPQAPRGLAVDDETSAWQRLFQPRAQAQGSKCGGEAVGQKAAPPATLIPGAWFSGPGRRCQSPPASRWPLPSFLSQSVGSGANPSSAPICLCDLGQAAPHFVPRSPLPEAAHESIQLTEHR